MRFLWAKPFLITITNDNINQTDCMGVCLPTRLNKFQENRWKKLSLQPIKLKLSILKSKNLHNSARCLIWSLIMGSNLTTGAISGRKWHTFRKNPSYKFPSLELTHNHKTWALKQVNPDKHDKFQITLSQLIWLWSLFNVIEISLSLPQSDPIKRPTL